MEDLKLIYENFNKAIAEGKLDESLEFRDEESKKSMQDYIKTPEEKAGTLQMLQAMVPISSTADHLEDKGTTKTLYLTAIFKDPEDATKTMKTELMITFSKEGEAWKMGTITYLANPDDIKKSSDQDFEPKENYDFDSETSMGGRVTSVKFEKNYTLVAIRMLDEEDLVFLPAKADLEKTGLKADQLEPWKILSVTGHKHKTNPLKIWGEKAEFVESN